MLRQPVDGDPAVNRLNITIYGGLLTDPNTAIYSTQCLGFAVITQFQRAIDRAGLAHPGVAERCLELRLDDFE